MTSRLIIHATNVHQGGGRALLDALLRVVPEKQEIVLLADERLQVNSDLARNIDVRRCRRTIRHRLLAERWLAGNAKESDTVLCFGNLPPMFRLCAHTYVLIQNRYLLDGAGLDGFPLFTRVRLTIERLWLLTRVGNADEIFVQTPSMKNLAESKFRNLVPVRVFPFVAVANGYARQVGVQAKRSKEFDFVFVATGEKHKNHRRLISTWCLLAAEGMFPSLCLTLDCRRFEDLCEEIEKARCECGVVIINAGDLSHADVLTLYTRAGALIYPSTFESFGLPLIEARQAGLPILASELDYVRDLVDPEQTFDPESPRSIARAVKRFLGENPENLQLQDASVFLKHVLDLKGSKE